MLIMHFALTMNITFDSSDLLALIEVALAVTQNLVIFCLSESTQGKMQNAQGVALSKGIGFYGFS